MERLTNHFEYCDFTDCKYRNAELAKENKCDFFNMTSRDTCHDKKIYEKLREYEDLEEQGLLLKLPCKVGDTIYSIGTRCDFGEAPDGGCDEMDCGDCYCSYDLIIKERAAKDFHIRRFLDGTSDYEFLTKAEAEKALAEMGGVGNEDSKQR